MARQALVSFDAVLCVVLLFCDVGCAYTFDCALDYTAATRGPKRGPRAALFFARGRVWAVFFLTQGRVSFCSRPCCLLLKAVLPFAQGRVTFRSRPWSCFAI
jgi:hypothetical protein